MQSIHHIFYTTLQEPQTLNLCLNLFFFLIACVADWGQTYLLGCFRNSIGITWNAAAWGEKVVRNWNCDIEKKKKGSTAAELMVPSWYSKMNLFCPLVSAHGSCSGCFIISLVVYLNMSHKVFRYPLQLFSWNSSSMHRNDLWPWPSSL